MKLKKEQSPDSFNWVEFRIDSETGQKVELDENIEEGDETIQKCEVIRICLRFLRIKEMNAMQNDVYNINAELKGKRTGSVTSSFNYGLYMEKKLETAIVEWENVLDEDGLLAQINMENIQLLPGWIGAVLVETIDEMNDMGVEILGE